MSIKDIKKDLILENQAEYGLLDSGDGEKLERFGRYVLRRPDPQALWAKTSPDIWPDADFSYSRNDKETLWKKKDGVMNKWNINFGGLNIYIKPTAFKHTGLFPEQLSNWTFVEHKIKNSNKKEIKVLNLFGYTGGVSLAAAKAGAEVVHIDGSKAAINWGVENQKLSKLEDKKIRWILEDAVKFVDKEIKRGNKYDGIIMDPPAYGHGPSKEVWKIENDLVKFVSKCKDLLSDEPLFFIINGYASGYSSYAYKNLLNSLEKFGGEIEHGELLIKEDKNARELPCGIYARWSKIQ